MPMFTNLPEAQKYARANNLPFYWRVIFPDRPSFGGWLANNHPRECFYSDYTQAENAAITEMRAGKRVDFCRMVTAETSDSPYAR